MAKKYAMVAINKREDSEGIHIRRVLITYLFKTKKMVNGLPVTYYHGTKLIDADPYFKDKKASHKYTLKNRYYKLEEVNGNRAVDYVFKSSIYAKRKYHNTGKLGFEFTAPNKQVAIHRFRVRKELK